MVFADANTKCKCGVYIIKHTHALNQQTYLTLNANHGRFKIDLYVLGVNTVYYCDCRRNIIE